MAVSSAPGKVYLFGEHAVVYGEPAVPCAIERRATVEVATRSDGRLRVDAGDLTLDGFTVEYGGDGAPDVDVPESLVEAATGYVDGAVEQAREAADAPEIGFDVAIESAIPLGAGLGSSAAVAVAGIDAATRELGVELPPEELAERAYRVEHGVQDGEASRADTFCSAMGGAVRVEGEDCRRLDAPSLPFVIGYDGGAGDTGALVAGVRELREEYDFAADTVSAIGDLVRQGERALDENDLDELGRLMDMNHGLLSALGVSARSLDAMVWAAREAGSRGAKLTGAGGGGCVVALDETEATRTALHYTPGCEEAFRAELDTDGVRQEGG
ncbi:mevalonate kinase [Halococcus saccharolyticus]|uniref:Mevalonate kinase n=1 Tax=Halococcus saccharolyticus DSM 5350 TaxID=1227455 RepID=M0MPQ5_9EURY|nr:mevalonate kinase [Halococcus saccharolyticus]EMA47343.1 mevalonate kinase [Halococcus saccharolyticus DSM 5350]